MEHDTPDTRIANSISVGDGKLAGGEDDNELVEFASCDMTSCYSNKSTTAP